MTFQPALPAALLLVIAVVVIALRLLTMGVCTPLQGRDGRLSGAGPA